MKGTVKLSSGDMKGKDRRRAPEWRAKRKQDHTGAHKIIMVTQKNKMKARLMAEWREWQRGCE